MFYKAYIFNLCFLLLASCQSSYSKKKNVNSPEYLGEKLFNDMACNACHTINGSLKLGPSLQNQYGKEILHTDGTILVVDDKYIAESLTHPLKYIVEGYTPIMPSYAPILKDQDIKNLIAYIKSLK